MAHHRHHHLRAALASLIVLALAPYVFAVGQEPHGGDIFLGIEENAIVTGLIDEKEETVDTPMNVFAAEFGDGGTPTQTSNPGFDSFAGTFPPGSRVGWNALDGIKVWDATSFVDAPGERFTISFTTALQVNVQDTPIAGFDLAVQADGAWHRHLTYQISRADALPPTNGVYLLALEMYSTSPSVGSSQPFWIVFNFGADESEHVAAIEWVHDNLAPQPTCPADFVESTTFMPPGDGVVNGADLAVLLGAWGANPGSVADIVENDTFMPPGDGIVDGADLAVLLGGWGPCRN